ncbi:MAG: 30S ribosomal protein S15 [Rickettsiales bacterium]|jgi:small subunit ribosomal protein S15|nr:30S ribosomal protein S15 [Rickettsiales bacterium]
MSITREKKTEVIKANRKGEKDTGSSGVQVAILTERINALTEHFKTHRKDNLSKTGLARMVSTRKKLLAYLKRTDPKGYEETIKKLGLRK